ncbi:MAG TPA: lipid A biosynthesis acyltransferase, partial [Comamonadaceae bacterium]|nr:lipid A biosynthesis acyltransferase [Comamonadaceae bacterium]
FVLAVPRRRVALRNLELCFPEVPAAQRRAWARESFVLFCQTFLDRSWLWSAPEDVVRSRLKLVGATSELAGDTPIIIFAPHFYGMDAGGLALLLQ